MLIRYLVNLGRIGILFSLFTVTLVANDYEWNLDALGDSATIECTLNENPIDWLDKKAKGVCAKITAEENAIAGTKLALIKSGLESLITGDPSFLYREAISQHGGSFDLGNLGICSVDTTPISQTPLGRLCTNTTKKVLSSALVFVTNTTDAGGIFSGALAEDKAIKARKRCYLSGLCGDELYDSAEITDAQGNTKNVDGGKAIAEMVEDPHGQVAKAIISDDIASLVLSDLALKNVSTSDPSAILLPDTKADVIDATDDAVQALIRLNVDLNTFIDALSEKLRNQYATNIIVGTDCASMMSLAKYRNEEKNVTAEYFKTKDSGIEDVYIQAELEAKGIMASKLLLETSKKGYIFDSSEARAAYISDEYKIPFRYAALIQQEKIKVMQYEVSRKLLRMKHMIDIAKKQAQIKSRIFRDDIAKCEIDRLLDAVDQSITY